jgi:hypothetical protein
VAKSELIEEIREAYLSANPDAAAATIDHFCEFVTRWLAEKPIVGVGMSASGMALRLADGTEIGLLTPAAVPALPDVAVGISTTGGSVRSGGSIEQPAISITGRR